MKSAVKKFKGLSDKAIAWIFITPTLILLLAINIYPLIYAIRMSFTNFYANKIGREPKFVGLKNYKKILGKEEIWEKMQITAHFVCWTLILQALIGLGLALLLNKKFKGNELLNSLSFNTYWSKVFFTKFKNQSKLSIRESNRETEVASFLHADLKERLYLRIKKQLTYY